MKKRIGGEHRVIGRPSLAVRPLTEEEKHAASLNICGRVGDVEQARFVLALLGLPHGRDPDGRTD